jgi:hypothetical protein
MNCEPVGAVFQSPKISFNLHNDKDYRYVTCKTPIKRGDLLLIEQCFTDKLGSLSCMKQMLRYNEQLFNSLYPRSQVWDESKLCAEDLPESILDLIALKIQYNSFGKESMICLGNNISQFNHSVTPNANVFSEMIDIPSITEGDPNFKVVFLYVLAIKDIAIGEELFIKYNENVKYSNYLDNNVKNLPPSESPILKEDYKDSNTIVMKIIKQYIRKVSFAEVTTTQFAMCKGLYVSKSMVNTTQRFNDYIQNEYNVPSNESVINQWVEFVFKYFSGIIID